MTSRKDTTTAYQLFACPFCKAGLAHDKLSLECVRCRKSYPVIQGIPDFRPEANRDIWGQKRILPLMLEAYGHTTAAELLDVMLAALINRSESQRATMRRYYLGELRARARHRIRLVNTLLDESPVTPPRIVGLEIGCGTGATAFELASACSAGVVGIDPNLLHLLIAKKHTEELGVQLTLACGFAEHLPFASESFNVINFMHTFEHFSDQNLGLQEVHRVMVQGGAVCFDVPNRYSLWREPHTKQWLVGFLPRRWTALSGIRNLSFSDLNSRVRTVFGSNYSVQSMFVRFRVPGYRDSVVYRALSAGLDFVEHVPGVGRAITWIQPGFEVVAWKT